jgi:hypothetical protein
MLCLALSSISFSYGQQSETKDTLSDYPVFIDRIHKVSVNSNSEWLFKILFKPPGGAENAAPLNKSVPINSFINNDAVQYNGRPIASIEIVVLDPFGYNLDNLIGTPDHWLPNLGNKFHLRSKEIKIRRSLMFQEGDLFDEYKLRESERLLRDFEAIKDVRMRLIEDKHQGDSIALQVIVHDYWSLAPDADLSFSRPKISIVEQNFLGYLHHVGFQYSFHSDNDSLQGQKGFVRLNNILGSYANAEVFYGTPLSDRHLGVSFNREFYSPLIKWSYGFENQWVNNRTKGLNIGEQGRHRVDLTYHNFESWVSHSLALDRINPHLKPHQRFIVNMGYRKESYHNRTNFFSDTTRLFYNRDLLLTGIGYSSRTFYKDRYIYGFGEYEDVKEGVLVALVGGYDFGNNPFTTYGAVHLAGAKHFPVTGHFAASLQYGGFLDGLRRLEHGTLNLSMSYFGDLYTIRRYKLRHFIYTGYVKGIRRQTAESISLSGSYGLYRFDDSNLIGTEKAFINMETIMYLPHNYWGFNFGLLVFTGFGLITNDNKPLLQNHLHQVYGLGFLVKNVYLQMNTIRISFGIYPRMGDSVQSVFQFNPISSYSLRFRELQFNKPYLPDYR